MLTPVHLIFYFFALVAGCSAIVVVTAKNPVRSVLALVVTFFAMSGIWMLLHAEFLSLILLLVYVGAVMTLFLFVVMMLSVNREASKSGFVRFLPVTLVIVIMLTSLMMIGANESYFKGMPMPVAENEHFSNLQLVGRLLYMDFAYPFEVAGVLLLAAIIAAIMLTHRVPHRRKMQNPSKQMARKAKDAVKIIKMASEPRYKG